MWLFWQNCVLCLCLVESHSIFVDALSVLHCSVRICAHNLVLFLISNLQKWLADKFYSLSYFVLFSLLYHKCSPNVIFIALTSLYRTIQIQNLSKMLFRGNRFWEAWVPLHYGWSKRNLIGQITWSSRKDWCSSADKQRIGYLSRFDTDLIESFVSCGQWKLEWEYCLNFILGW